MESWKKRCDDFMKGGNFNSEQSEVIQYGFEHNHSMKQIKKYADPIDIIE